MTTDPQTSRAILIGVTKSTTGDFTPVAPAFNSVTGMKRILTNPDLCGWPADTSHVKVVRNPRDPVKLAVDLRTLVSDVEDVLLLYFVGHGVKTPDGHLCLVLTDTTKEHVDVTGLDYRQVATALRSSPARVKVVILDCCYSGTAHKTLGVDIASMIDIEGVYTLTASAANEPAQVTPPQTPAGSTTAFTGQFIELVEAGIPDGPPELTFDVIYPHLRQRLLSRGLPEPSQSGQRTAHHYAFTKNAASQPPGHGMSPPVWEALLCAPQGKVAVTGDDDETWAANGTGDRVYLVVADGHRAPENFRSYHGALFAVQALGEAFEHHRSLSEKTWTDWAPEFVAARWRTLVHDHLALYPPSIDNPESSLEVFLDSVREEHSHSGLEKLFHQLRLFESDGPPDRREELFPNWHITAYATDLVGVVIGPEALHWLHLGPGAAVQVVGGDARYLVGPRDRTKDVSVAAMLAGTTPLGSGHVPAAVVLATSDDGEFLEFCDDLAGVAPDKIPRWLSRLGADASLAIALSTESVSGRPVKPSVTELEWEANHQGINVEGNLTVGGDVNANNTVTHSEPTQPVTDDLRRRVEELSEALRPGTRLRGRSQRTLVVGRAIGQNREGSVYEAETAGRPVALKWFRPDFQRQEIRRNIADLVDRGTPGSEFLWPEDVVTWHSEFGYVRPRQPADMVPFAHLLSRKTHLGFADLLAAARNIVAAFESLRRAQLFFHDVSDANLLVHPHGGDVLVVNVENLGSHKHHPPILGTPRYMAPEIVRADSVPSETTDSYSLAVLLFLLLMNDHPLHGAAVERIRCFDAAAMRHVYGAEPLFVFDPQDDSNGPVPGVHLNAPIFWSIYPPSLRALFTQTFTSGLHDPTKRPSLYEWQLALSGATNALVSCGRCGKQNFLDSAATCWHCQEPLRQPDVPGQTIYRRPLRFIWVLDVSQSMEGTKIGQLNYAIREALPALRQAADDNPHSTVEMKVLAYGSDVQWMTTQSVPLDSFTWADVALADGSGCRMGQAMRELATELSQANMPERALSPVVVLITDGTPTDDFVTGLDELLAQPWARKAVRIGVGIGDNADLDTLRQFIANPEVEPLSAKNPQNIVNHIRWTSTQVLKATSLSGSLPALPAAPIPNADASDVW